jgi:hypothetical protein
MLLLVGRFRIALVLYLWTRHCVLECEMGELSSTLLYAERLCELPCRFLLMLYVFSYEDILVLNVLLLS